MALKNSSSLTKSDKLKGNVNASRNPTRSFLRKRLILHPEDQPCAVAGSRLTSELMAECPDTAVARALATQAGLARALTLLALSEAVRHRDTERGAKARAEIARHMASERLALAELGAHPKSAIEIDAFEVMATPTP